MNQIIFSESIAQDLSQVLSEISFSRLFVFTDTNTEKHCLPLIKEVLPEDSVYCSVPWGEKNKTLSSCELVWNKMTENQLDRKALFLNLGGGVVSDMGGFCSSIYKRGICFINIPTTLLSQVDASVGGKLGVDFQGFKNHLGVFNEPETVLISPEFLETLPKRELRSGFAEVIKHGLIQDASYFRALPIENWHQSDWKKLIHHSVEIKKAVVKADPKEAGLRKILNFGHTVGHALETYFLDTPNHLLHGEAIAAGMICEAYLSKQETGLPERELEEIQNAFLSIYGKIKFEEKDLSTVLDLCLQDKKNEGSTLLFTLLRSIGDCTYNIPVSREKIQEALIYYQSLSL